MNKFQSLLAQTLGETFDLKWDIDRKGVVCGWCKLAAPDDILTVAEVVAGLKGRVLTISPLNTPSSLFEQVPVNSENTEPKKPIQVIINYHFYFNGINLTAAITLPDDQRTVHSITPTLRSADWHGLGADYNHNAYYYQYGSFLCRKYGAGSSCVCSCDGGDQTTDKDIDCKGNEE